MTQELYVILLALLLSAMFSGLEMAFISASRLHVALAKEKGFTGKILSLIANNPSQFIATTLVGNTLALSLYGVFMAKAIDPLLAANLPVSINNDFMIFLIQISFSTIVVLLTAEFMPKTLFLIAPLKILRIFSIPMGIVFFVLYPFVIIIVGLSKLVITKILGLEFSTVTPAFGLTDLNHFVASTLENIDDEVNHEVDTKILHNALEFKSVKLRECMIPRTEMVAVDMSDGIEELAKAFIESGHSKILIYKDSIDNIRGFCQSKEMFKKPAEITDIMKSLIIVPETMLANELLVQFIKDNKSMALVVDEFGGTSGIVTMEDVIEEILGDIQDEHDEEQLLEEKIDDNTFVFSARHEVDYLNEEYNLQLPEGDYETLGGLILLVHKDIPQEADVIQHERFTFEVIQTQNNRIETVKLKVESSES